MASWNKVVSGFQNEDETINFGARTLAENNGSLYEAYTIATIESGGKVTKEPNVIASIQSAKVCIVIDKSITIFESEQYEEVLSSITFELDITCYCVSHCGRFAFVVLSNGTLCCLQLFKGEVIFTKNITENEIKIIAVFLQNETNGFVSIYAVSEKGAIYKISGIDTEASQLIASNESKELATINECVKCTELFKGFSWTEVTYAAAGTVGGSMYIAMLSSNALFMWPNEHCIKYSMKRSYTKVKFLKNYMAMLCLRADQRLCMICPRTLLGVMVYDTPVTDFVIIENNDNSSCHIVTITSYVDCTKCTLHVLSYPGFQQKFQITVPVVTFLVEIMDPCDETILYLEGVNANAVTEYIDTIRMKTVSESMPEHQLGRLIRREQFDAAEDFANKFNLSKEPIYCAKAALLLSQIGPWAKERPDPSIFDTILDIFGKIENVQYIAECCSKVLIPSYEQMRKFHLYARSRIMENNMTEYLNLLPLINDVSHKLETFHMIWGCRRDLDYYDEDTVMTWIRFSKANFLEEYKTHLRMGEIEAATSIWTRHLPDMIKHVTIEMVKDIFAILPEDISPSALWPWLSNYIPTLLSFLPSAMCEIILWGCKRIKLFEHFYHSKWPQIGIDFANKFIKVLRFEESDRSLCLQQEYSEGVTNLKQLTLLMQAMSDIKKLKDNYRLLVSLDSYMGDPIEVIHILLDKVHVDVIPEFVNTFLKRYMLNNSVENDHAFSSYIQKILRDSKGWWLGEEAVWEEKVVVIIDLIQKIEIKLQQTLEVLKQAPVPWSSTIMALAEASSKYNHALMSEIRIELSFVPVKLILKKYGYERVSVTDKLMQRVIKENRDSMISDLQQLTKNDVSLKKKIFSNCVNYHLSMGSLEVATKVLNSLENDVLLHCCESIGRYVEAALKFRTVPEYIAYHIEMFGWVALQLEGLSKVCKAQSRYCNNTIDSLNRIKSMYYLKKDFQISITPEEYYLKKKEILQDYFIKLSSEALEKEVIIYKKLSRVADLLALQRIDAISSLLESTKTENLLNCLIRYIKGQLSKLTNEPRYAYKICLPLMQHPDKVDADLAATIQNLCSLALSVCPSEELQSVLSLYSWANMYKECFSKSLSYGSSAIDTKQEVEEVPRTEWTLYEIYEDPAIGTDESIFSLFTEVISMQKSKLDEVEKNSSTEDSMKKLIEKMKRLRGEHNDYCLLQIVKTVYLDFCSRSQINNTLLTEMKSIYLQRLTMLLKKVISARGFDLQLGLSCLFMLSDSEACAWISTAYKSYQPDCVHHLRVVELGYEYFHLTKNHTLLQPFQNNKLLYYWASRLSKYSVSYNQILRSDLTAKREILQGIMTFKDDMIPLFREFCTDFGFDTQDCLLLYLEVVAKSWSPMLNVNNCNGKAELRIDEEEVNDLRKKCDLIASHIPDKIALKSRVKTILSEINFYHYEVFIILMDLINEKNIEHRTYFYFLQNYTRVGPPTKIELDEWLHINPGYTSVPPIAKWRLPYLPKVQLLNIITPELNLKTYEKWLEIADILKLQSHIICTLAIKGEVTQVWENTYRTTEWSLCQRNSGLLNDIKKCIEKMTDSDALHYGTVALYYTVNHMPPGADQVAAVEECYKFAQLAVQKSVQFQEAILEKIKFKYLRFSTEHILRTHDLGDVKYLSLIGNPDKLVRELYTDESIPKRYQYTTDHRPDINSAVNSISKLHSINVVKLRMELLQEWLQPDVKYLKLNQSVTETFSIAQNSESNSNNYDNLARACYILEHGDLELSANFLINIAFDDKNEDYCPEARYRALCVLQSIVDPVNLENLTKRDHRTITNYMKSLKYISKLESLGISCSVNAFGTYSKHSIVQMLWKTQRYSPQALITIAELCVDFEIYEYSLWDKILAKLAESLMIVELKKILLQVRNINVIVNSNGYLRGWEVITSEPFRKMDVNPTCEQIENCISALRLLYSCPVVRLLSFKEIVRYCFQCKQAHLAMALLPFLNHEETQFTLEKLKHTSNIEKISEDLNNLVPDGILFVDYCNKIIKKYIN